MKMICVDDERTALDAMCELCNEFDEVEEVVGFNKVSLALNYIKENQVDVVLTDIMMPVMNGFEFAEKAKAEVGDQIYFIFTTGFSEVANEAMRMGKHGFIRKPFGVNELKKELDYYKNEFMKK